MKKQYVSGYSYITVNNIRVAQSKLIKATSSNDLIKIEKEAIKRIIDKMSIMELRELGFSTEYICQNDYKEEGYVYSTIFDRRVKLTLNLEDVIQTVEA